ncbi:MAG: enoyl-CoA hydratase/isomerase family protein [Anaerolineales bacterium]|nr:enoyl-CoA hydratase/isomerase family protein [Anaerolineales bacterium]
MEGIDFTVEGQGVGLLTIHRPQVRNALNWAAMEAFAQAIEQAHALGNLCALIVTGLGKAFVSGGDLSELQHYPSHVDGLRLASVMGDALARLEALPCPTIAAINGPARGGGAEIAVACDLRVIAADADIGFVHSRLGIVPAWGGGQRLLRLVGYARALDLIASGRVLPAGEALAMRLADFLSPVGEALATARQVAARFSANPPAAVRAAKRLLRFGLSHPNEVAFQAERAEFPWLWDSEFRCEAVRKFLNRSKPTEQEAGERVKSAG